MSQISCSLSDLLIERVKKLAKNENKTFSGMIADLVTLGLRIKDLTDQDDANSTEKAWEELYQNQVRATFQILELCRETLRMVYINNKSEFKADFENVDRLIEGVRTQINNRIDGKVSKFIS